MQLDPLVPLLLSADLVLTALWVTKTRRHKPTWKTGVFLLLDCAVLVFARGMQAIAPDLADKVFWYKLFFIGFAMAPTAFLWIAFHYSGADRFLTRRMLLLLNVVPLLTVAIIASNESHGLMWKVQSTEAIVREMQFLSTQTTGPWYWPFVAYSYAVATTGLYFVGRLLLRSRDLYRWQFTAVVLAVVCAAAGIGLDISHASPLTPFVATELGLGGGIITVALALNALRRTDLLSVSREAILNNISDAILVVDGDGRLAEMNTTAARILSRARSDALGSRVNELLPELPALSSQETGGGRELRLMHDGHTRVFDVRVSTIKDARDAVAGRVVAMRDITERKLAEEKIQRLNDDLERRVLARTHKLELANKELESFTYSVSHDLRGPLRLIDGYSRILAEDYGRSLDPRALEVCNVVQRESRRMGNLIDALLSFSRSSRATLNIADIDMTAMATEVFAGLVPDERRGRIDFSIDPLPPAHGDPDLMRQVWSNLLSNAIKFSAQCERPVIKVSATTTDSEVTYVVSDNGVGFDLQYADKLFGVFQRMHNDPRFPGTGVGLAIVHRVLQRHGGSVRAEAEPGKGARFYFTLPHSVGDRD